ncbi:MAG: hypothetical protein R2710_13900 [Acidimicrobiales bacterium]
MNHRHHRLLVVLFGIAAVVASCGSSSDEDLVAVDATIDSLSIADASPSNPLPLDPREESTLALTLDNTTDRPVAVERVRVEGELLGLNFLTYDVRVRLTLEPGETRQLDVPLDFFELERQANGYLRSYVRIYDDSGGRVGGQSFALDIKGDSTSMMVLFSIGLFAITAATAALNMRDLRRGQLPEQRFARGVRFFVPGLGLGLMLSVAFSVFRIFPLPATSWVPLTVVPALAGFFIGYAVIPGPDDTAPIENLDDLDDEELLEALRPEDIKAEPQK